MDARDFMRKWGRADLTERSASQQHFLDLCELLDHPKPADADPTGEWFTFEKGADKQAGGKACPPAGRRGWADVWKKGTFAWEYKGNHKDLDAAYRQLLEYREALENPPLLVVSDMDRIIVRTNFTATPTEKHEVRLLTLSEPRSLEILRAVFHAPDKLRPGRTSQAITAEAAERIADIAQSMRGRGLDAHQVAAFLDRIVFCLFAEDVELLPQGLFSSIVEKTHNDPDRFSRMLGQLFDAMADGGDFGADRIRHFNGSLFVKGPAHLPAGGQVLQLTDDEIQRVYEASKLNWGAVDPSIFGTLFERGMDPDKRSQIGAHYTGREDIETLVEPVVMWPLRREWDETRQTVDNLLATGRKLGRRTATEPRQPAGGDGGEGEMLRPPASGLSMTSGDESAPQHDSREGAAAPARPLTEAQHAKARDESERLVRRFHGKLTQIKVLDPACGSGNFLYVTLQKLKDLEKEVILFAHDRDLGRLVPMVGPWQLFGIEINPYAYDLAQMVVWIGYLQWVKANGLGEPTEPILKPMEGNFQNKDAILDLGDPPAGRRASPEEPVEPEWPRVDYIVGNPPFLGGKLMRNGLGDGYVDRLFELWEARVPHEADLCCYWFEKARAHIERGWCQRAGLLATQGIRGGTNRKVLERIKETGDIFFAESDRPWVLDGANVHVSMVGFHGEKPGETDTPLLDGKAVQAINANLTASADLAQAALLPENVGISFMGITPAGAFDVPLAEALSLLQAPNPNGLPSSDVLRPYFNGRDLNQRPRYQWTVDFGVERSQEEASRYAAAFRRVEENVRPARERNKRESYRRLWWLYAETRPAMRLSFARLDRYLATCMVAKHRVFVWLPTVALPANVVIVFARSDDYFFGVLHSRLHEAWARAQGTQLRERESGFRYTPTTCFETFPFPWPPGTERQLARRPGGGDGPLVVAIAEAARELNELRESWLNPPEWTTTEVLEFPGSIVGPWARYVHDPDERGIGTVRYPRVVDNGLKPSELKKRTLTNLYNEMPAWLRNAHRRLDEAVCAAYAAATGPARRPAGGDPGWTPDMPDEEILEKLLALNLERQR